MINVGIVILNWNGYEDTIECLKSLNKLDLTDISTKVLVVDNASVNDSVKEIKKEFRNLNLDVEIMVNDHNLGFAGGNNVGLKFFSEKKYEHILVLNNDTLVARNTLYELVKFAKKNLKYGILSPKIYFAKGFEYHKKRYKKSELGKVIWAAGGEMDWRNVFGKNRGVDEVDDGQYDKAEEIDFATGAAMLINSKLLDRIGLFDERYFMYFEDADLVKRAENALFKNYYAPKAKVWHKVARSSKIGGDLNDYFITRNRLFFGMKYAPLRTKLALYRESFKFIVRGRRWQKTGTMDYYLRRFGKGSWKN